MANYTYDVSQHFVVIGGVPITGFHDGSEITLEMDEDAFTRQVDVDGKNVIFNKSNNYLATLTFTLNFGTDDNDFLSGVYQAFRQGSGGIVPIMVKDNNGRSIITGSGAIQQIPSLQAGSESSGREWTIGMGQTQIFIGGANAAPKG